MAGLRQSCGRGLFEAEACLRTVRVRVQCEATHGPGVLPFRDRGPSLTANADRTKLLTVRGHDQRADCCVTCRVDVARDIAGCHFSASRTLRAISEIAVRTIPPPFPGRCRENQPTIARTRRGHCSDAPQWLRDYCAGNGAADSSDAARTLRRHLRECLMAAASLMREPLRGLRALFR